MLSRAASHNQEKAPTTTKHITIQVNLSLLIMGRLR